MGQAINPVDRSWRRPQDTGAGNAITKRSDRWTRKMFHFAGSFAGGWDLTLQGTLDGVNWTNIQANIITDTVVEPDTNPDVDFAWVQMRVVANVVGTQTSAALTITMSGRQGE